MARKNITKKEKEINNKTTNVSAIIDGLDIMCSVDENRQLPNNYIIANKINIQIGNKIILQNAELKLTKGNKYGLIGANGSGKSTIINCIYHNLIPSHKDINIIQVEQTFTPSNKSVYDTLLETNKELYELKLKINYYESKEDDMDDKEIKDYTNLIEKMTELNFSSNDSEIRKILHGFGFSIKEMESPTSSFSGGWQRRISLAKVLYLNSDIILLDEPTNHLDLEAVIWLSNYLSNLNKILVIISHSTDFLEKVCNETIFLCNKELRQYHGNYSKAKKILIKDEETLNKKYKDLEKKLLEMSKKHKTKKEKQEFIKIQNLPEKILRYNVIYPKYKSNELKGNLIKLENIKFSYTNKILLENINLELKMGDRYTLVGRNGSGKSTLLKILNNDLQVDENIIYHPSIRIGIYNQHFDTILPSEETPLSYLLPLMTNDMTLQGDHTSSIRKYLGMIKLDGKAHLQKIGTLSGGQKSRVAWLSMILKRPHLILLDEPTNHMDLEGIEGMIETLKLFNGCLIIVTHDPTLITQLETELLVLKNNTVSFWEKSYDDYYDKVLKDLQN